MPRPKIAIVGGGPAGLSAAFHLTNEKSWETRIDTVTVYQMGWRLGGKGATGRDAERGWRLEEHGIHGFCRFYFNTFRMMEQVYAELSQENLARLPVRSMPKAFLGSSLTLGVEHVDGKWSMRPSHLPRFPGEPWGPGPFDVPGPRELVRRILEQMLRRGRSTPLEELDARDLVPRENFERLGAARQIHGDVSAELAAIPWIDGPEAPTPDELARWTALIERIVPGFAALFRDARDAAGRTGDVGAFGSLSSLDLYTALLRGLIVDGVLWPGRDLDDLDGEDYRDWLRRHGASRDTCESSTVYTIANMLFAYPGGDCMQAPQLSAASWLGWILRTLRGRGEYFYLMAAGTGETVILPLYLLLKQRGVKFEFFHRLTGVESSAGPKGELVLERLLFDRQARPKAAEYDPIVDASPLGFGVWPNQPELSRLENGKSGLDYEAWDDARGGDEVTLTRGEGFDYAVWAMPPSMIPVVGDAGLQRAWSAVTAKVPTTATQAVQIWLRKATVDLGGPPCKYPERYATASFPNPLNGMVSFDDVLCFEGWNDPKPLGLFYLCAALAPQWPPSESTRPDERKRVFQSTLYTLSLIGNFFPDALPEHPDPRDPPMQIDFELLHPLPGSGNHGANRLFDQYIRVNTRPTEMYAQAPSGTASGRLDPWQCGYTNLVPAGDWIYTGINVGAFESAVTGGKLAAFALTGRPDIGEIEAYGYFHPRAPARARAALLSGRVPLIG